MTKNAILCMDTTTSRLMLGIGRDNALIADQIIPCDSHRYHSALIVPAIQDMLGQAGLSVRDLSALAVNHGPGSFTGIRTGIITVRTMAQFLNLPVHVFNTFELVATTQSQPVAVYLDGLRGKSYHATLSLQPEGPVYSTEPSLIQLSTEGNTTHPGAIPLIAASLFPFFPNQSLLLLDDHFSTPSAMMSLIARYGQAFAKPWQDVRPLYLQEPSITIKKPLSTQP